MNTSPVRSAAIAALSLFTLTAGAEEPVYPTAPDVDVSDALRQGCGVLFEISMDDTPGYLKVWRTTSTGAKATSLGNITTDWAHDSYTLFDLDGNPHSWYYIDLTDSPGSGSFKYYFRAVSSDGKDKYDLPTQAVTFPGRCSVAVAGK